MKCSIKNKDFVVAVSFANYLTDKSGVPKVMMAQQKKYNQAGISYISLFSVKKMIANDSIMLFCKYGLLIDGKFCGIYQMSQIINFLAAECTMGKCLLDMHIHHLLYNDLRRISELLSSVPTVPIKVYLHDYYNACCNYTLMKNGSSFCGGKGLGEAVCKGCSAYKKSQKIQPQIHRLFRAHQERITFISPSQTTKNIFENFHPEYKGLVKVIPHQKCVGSFSGNLDTVVDGEKLKVAFLAMPRKHKGWDTWTKIVQKASSDQYEFIVFNSSDEQHENMTKVKVAFSENQLNAMVDALRANQVHIALLWSLCPETYSYTCFEAYAANAFLITGKDSGNIADVVSSQKLGWVLDNEKELEEVFLSERKLRDAVNMFRSHTSGGPLYLEDNDQIVQLSMENQNRSHAMQKKRKVVNYPLLALLNWLYRINERNF